MRHTKRILSFVFVLMLLFTLFVPALPVFAADGSEFAGGSGTAADPWLIKTAEQLDALRNYVGEENGGKVFALANDIDLSDFLANHADAEVRQNGWQPIGYYLYKEGADGLLDTSGNVPFCGTLEGNGHVISGLWIHSTELHNVGLFGYILDASIRDLNLVLDDANGGITVDYSVTSEGNFMPPAVGGLVGLREVTERSSAIEYCTVAGMFRAEDYCIVGGLVGRQYALYTNGSADMQGCAVWGSFSGAPSIIGGLLGHQELGGGCQIIECAVTMSVAGGTQDSIGGLVGATTFWSATAQVNIRDSYVVFETALTARESVGAMLSNVNSVQSGSCILEGCYFTSEQQPELPGVALSPYTEVETVIADDTKSVTARQMTRWSTFTGWDDNVWGIDEGVSAPTLKPAITITPKPQTVFYTGEAPVRFETVYTISGAYDPAQPLAGTLTIEADPDGQYRAGEYAYAWPTPDPNYNITLAGDATCTILGAAPTLLVDTKQVLSTEPCAVTYTVRLSGDETGGVPAGVVALYVDGELLAENLPLDEDGTLVYEVAGQADGQHELTVTYTGGVYYYPAETTQAYQNYNLLLFVCLGGGGVLLVSALVVFLVLRGKRKKAKKAAAGNAGAADVAGDETAK